MHFWKVIKIRFCHHKSVLDCVKEVFGCDRPLCGRQESIIIHSWSTSTNLAIGQPRSGGRDHRSQHKDWLPRNSEFAQFTQPSYGSKTTWEMDWFHGVVLDSFLSLPYFHDGPLDLARAATDKCTVLQ
jgi:hypothetical protein